MQRITSLMNTTHLTDYHMNFVSHWQMIHVGACEKKDFFG